MKDDRLRIETRKAMTGTVSVGVNTTKRCDKTFQAAL